MAEGWDKLAEMNVPVGFVMGGDAQATTGEENTREMVWRAPNAKNERIMDAGHLVSTATGASTSTSMGTSITRIRDAWWSWERHRVLR
jgi:pimeloyl-ACP methyl ester carboxylesterase